MKKYTKKLKGDETIEAKTDLNFEVLDEVTGEITSLNGTTRNKTDANIRKHFGAFEDFSMSSLSSQHGAFTFIDEGSTKRKEIIAKFLDLEFFDQKFKLAKEDSQETKVLLKKSADREFDTEIEKVEEDLQKAKKQTDEKGVHTTFTPTIREGKDLLKPGGYFKGLSSGTLTDRLNFASLMLALFCGTASLPHILIRYYTVKDASAARKSTAVVLAALHTERLRQQVWR